MLLKPVLPMHIPDGFLSAWVSIILWIVAIPIIGRALRQVGREMQDRQVPLMGVLAAAIFAGQMLNFAVAGGTSGHLLGAALATMLLGPWPAIVIMTTVVSIQALVFQDGGLLALGPNLFNMAIIGVSVSHFAYSSVRRLSGGNRAGIIIGAAVAAWLSIVVAALACALELSLSGSSPANLAIPAMAGIHALIGLGEAAITVGAAAFLLAARSSLLTDASGHQPGATDIWLTGGALTLLLVALSPLASAHPDGLEWVAEQQGFLDLAERPVIGIIPDYMLPGIENTAAATVAAAAIGAILVLGTTLVLANTRKSRSHH